MFINRVYPPQRGATGRMLKDLAHAFAREGWQVKIVATGPQTTIERESSIRIHRVKGPERPRLITYPWIWLQLLRTAFKAGDANLIISMTDPPLTVVAGKILARKKKARHIHWCQDYYPGALKALGLNPPPFIFRRLNALNKSALRSCDKVIVVGRCIAKRMMQDTIDMAQVMVVPNWADSQLIRKVKREARHFNNASSDAAMRIGSKPHALQMKSGPKFRVLYAGNIGRAHPVRPVLDAAEILQGPYPEIEFVFVGDGKRFEWLARERDKRGLENIRLMPFQPAHHLREIMESGDIHLISLANEAKGYLVPSKLYAALTVGRPVVFMGPQKSEIARVLADFKAGETIDPNNPTALAEVIKNFRTDADYWFTAQEGSARAGQVYSPDASIKVWIEQALAVIQGLKR